MICNLDIGCISVLGSMIVHVDEIVKDNVCKDLRNRKRRAGEIAIWASQKSTSNKVILDLESTQYREGIKLIFKIKKEHTPRSGVFHDVYQSEIAQWINQRYTWQTVNIPSTLLLNDDVNTVIAFDVLEWSI